MNAHTSDLSIETGDLSASCRQFTGEGADIALDLKAARPRARHGSSHARSHEPCGAPAQNRSERNACPSRAPDPRAIHLV